MQYHTANGGSTEVLTESTLHFCVGVFSLKPYHGQSRRMRYSVSSSKSLLVSLSKITFSFTRAIEIRAPDKDPLMVFGAEIGSGTTLQ